MTAGALFEVHGGAVFCAGRTILDELRFEIPDHVVLAVVGDDGKTALLRALAGQLPAGTAAVGSWRYRGQPLRWHQGDVRFAARGPVAWDDVFADPARTLLLEDPTLGATPAAAVELATRVRAHRARGAVVLVSADPAFAHAVADLACVVSGSRVRAPCDAAAFFDRPREARCGSAR